MEALTLALGIAKKMMEQLIAEAKEKGVTHLSLDATKEGRQLYYKLGFSDTAEGMELKRSIPVSD